MTWPRALSIFSRLRQAKQRLEQAKQRLDTLQNKRQADPVQIAQAQVEILTCAASVHHWQEASSAWRQHLSNLSRIVHPWRLSDSRRQSRQLKSSCKPSFRPLKRFLRATNCR